MKVGVLIGGDVSVRAAHSLAADPLADSVVVVGPATSRSFEVVDDPSACDLLIGSGSDAPARARKFGLPLVWDGSHPADGVAVWGASPIGLALAMSSRERRPVIAASAHPDHKAGTGPSVRFARPVGATQTDEVELGDHVVRVGKSYNEYAACQVAAKGRRVTIVDRAAFLSGVALAAGVAAYGGSTRPIWDADLSYLETAIGMGLVMAEA